MSLGLHGGAHWPGMERPGAQASTQATADAHVRRAPWFISLPGDLQSLVLRTARVRVLAAGTTVGWRGAVPQQWVGVVHGVLKASASNAEGRVSSHLLAVPTQWIEGEELVQGMPRLHDVIAVSDSIVVVIDAAVFRRLILCSVEFCGFVLKQVSQQHRRFLERMDRSRSLSTSVLVAQTVAELADGLGNGKPGSVALPQEDIAEFVGLTRQTVNQVLKQLETEGLLRTRYGRVEVANIDALRDFTLFKAVQA